MKKLWMKLSPFTPDTSGACSALFGLDGLLMIHNAQGCLNNFRAYDEPRWEEQPQNYFSSETSEMDVILGNEGPLIEKIMGLVEKYSPAFVGLLGSPIPMLIGTDLRGLAKEVEEQLQIPVISLDTTGHQYYDSGISIALLRLGQSILRFSTKTLPRGINLLGATPLDLGLQDSLQDIKKFMEINGWNILSCWSMGATLKELEKATAAALNLVVSWSGLALARWLERTFGIPYIVGNPVGQMGGENLLKLLEEAVKTGVPSKGGCHKDEKLSQRPKVLIIGEQIGANSLRQCLSSDFNIEAVQIASFFGIDQEHMKSGDQELAGEDDLQSLLDDNDYRIVIGDPFFQSFIKPEKCTDFWAIPHMPISSQFKINQMPSLIGKKGTHWVHKQLHLNTGEEI
ncbi:MAG: hypothetical protein APF81_25150 [Desulfosporosinus sp. BRH_c37]|nr:MAG: hypothetical protein APF81_25150 [Desulfosporosinus sp. BRH_c37]